MENKDRFFIPKTIRVGYQDREDTYTGKLAYVIYIDQTGKVRKETSWNNWRHHKFEPNDFDNIPTEGFVLNKHVGGCQSYWNFRQSYCRIYDPRGFEFEITIDNLLWILDWVDCLHGKGLEGKFVYGWINDQLYLIPCNTDDYTISQDISDKMYNEKGMKKSDLIPGSSYKIKNVNHPYIFVGNLKVQNKLGAGFKTHMFFYDPEPEEWDGYKKDALIRVEKSSILCKVTDNVMDKAEVDEMIHRFNLTAYSYDFWHTENIIDRFVNNLPDGIQLKHNKRYRFDAMEKYARFGIISEDQKSVDIMKPYIWHTEKKGNTGYWRSYTSYEKHCGYYHFITLNNKCNVNKVKDFGRLTERENNSYFKTNIDFHSLYLDIPRDISEDMSYRTNEFDTTPSELYYITNDGYISNSLMEMILDGALNYISDTKNIDISVIVLPTKI